MVPAGASISRLTGFQEFLRLRRKAFAAPRAAKEIILAVVAEAVFCGRAVDLHAADRIDRDCVLLAAMLATATGMRGRAVMRGVRRMRMILRVPVIRRCH